MQSEKSGVLWAIGSFLIWGIMPIYWKSLEHVASTEIFVSRVVWAFILTLLASTSYEKWSSSKRRFKNYFGVPNVTFGAYSRLQSLISSNWFHLHLGGQSWLYRSNESWLLY